MNVIRQVVYGDEFSLLTGDDAGNVFLQFVVVLRQNEILSAFNGKHDVELDLGVGLGQVRKIPLLMELESLFCLGSATPHAYGIRALYFSV